jgi:hypothetical protein
MTQEVLKLALALKALIKRLNGAIMDRLIDYPAVYVLGSAFVAAASAMVAWKLVVYLIFGSLT